MSGPDLNARVARQTIEGVSIEAAAAMGDNGLQHDRVLRAGAEQDVAGCVRADSQLHARTSARGNVQVEEHDTRDCTRCRAIGYAGDLSDKNSRQRQELPKSALE